MMRRLVIAAAAAGVLLPAAAADAAPPQVVFSAKFEAQKTVEWDWPRTEGGGDCNGRTWAQAHGTEDQRVQTRPFRVVVTGTGRFATWKFGRGSQIPDPREVGVDAFGPHKREANFRSGTLGGWCSGPKTNAPPEQDCGTRLPEYRVVLLAHRGKINWSLSYKDLPRERFTFFKCRIFTPEGLPALGFPNVDGTVRMADVVNRRKKTIVVEVAKTYGPSVYPLGSSGVNETRSGAISWKLTLTRVKK